MRYRSFTTGAEETADCSAVDETLISDFKRTGSPRPFEILFGRYAKRLHSVAWHLYRNPDSAEECVQETFRRAIQQIHRFGEAGRDHNFWAWLVTIARDVYLSELRHEKTRAKYLESKASMEVLRTPITQDQQAMISELLRLIRAMPRPYRICYLLLFVDGCTYEEIARITGYNHGQVRTFIQSARRHVNRKFRNSGVSEQAFVKNAGVRLHSEVLDSG
jgi:RNA polymerase sigma-70 factor, ECF subfamily